MPGAREFGRDVRLQVREAEHEVGTQRDDAVDLRAGECGHFRLLAPRPRRAHGEARDADDARVLAEEVQRLGRLLGEADDAFGIGCPASRHSSRHAIAGAGALCHAAAMTPFARLHERVERLLFDRHHLPVKTANWLLDVLRYPFALVRDLLTGELNLRAMGLVYTTLLSLVPLAAFAFAVLKGLGVHRDLEPLIYEFLRPIGERATELTAQFMTFVDNVRGDVLGLGRPRLPALHRDLDHPEARGSLQLRLARRAPALDHAPRQRVPEPDGRRARCSSSSSSACSARSATMRPCAG